jgi:DNA-binding CsgD family transcriptional regulator
VPSNYRIRSDVFQLAAIILQPISRLPTVFSQTHLNFTFDFLLPSEDNIPAWILKDDDLFAAYLAGYTDAEGNIGVYNGQAVFRLASYDKNVLHQIHAKLVSMGIECPKPRLSRKKGYTTKDGHKYKKDLWCLWVGRMASLLKLFDFIEPYLRHAKRRRDLERARRNVEERSARWQAKPVEITEAELRRLYCEERLSQAEIARILGCSQPTVCEKMQKYGIKARSKTEAWAAWRARQQREGK